MNLDIDDNIISIGDTVTYLSWEETWIVYKTTCLQPRAGEKFIVAEFTDNGYIKLNELNGTLMWGCWRADCMRKA